MFLTKNRTELFRPCPQVFWAWFNVGLLAGGNRADLCARHDGYFSGASQQDEQAERQKDEIEWRYRRFAAKAQDTGISSSQEIEIAAGGRLQDGALVKRAIAARDGWRRGEGGKAFFDLGFFNQQIETLFLDR